MNYLAFINSVSSVNRMTAFSVFTDQIAVLAAGTLSMTIASLRAKRLRAYTAGAVLGTMIATPLVAVIRTQLYFGPVGCTGYGTKTVEFPEGMPIGCDHESTAFQVTYQLTKGLVVALVVGFAIVGQKTVCCGTRPAENREPRARCVHASTCMLMPPTDTTTFTD